MRDDAASSATAAVMVSKASLNAMRRADVASGLNQLRQSGMMLGAIQRPPSPWTSRAQDKPLRATTG